MSVRVSIILFCIASIPGYWCSRSLFVPLYRVPVDYSITNEQATHSDYYYASVGIGTPPKQMNITFDLKLKNTFLAAYSNKEFSSSGLSDNIGLDCSNSSTCTSDDQDIIHVKHNLLGPLAGKLQEDLFAFELGKHDLASEKILFPAYLSWMQPYVAISNYTAQRKEEVQSHANSTPIMNFFGLSMKPDRSNLVSTIEALKYSGFIDQVSFGFRLTPKQKSFNIGGSFVIGQLEKVQPDGEVSTFDLPPGATDWTLSVSGCSLNDVTLTDNQIPYFVNFDLNLNGIHGPKHLVERIYTLLDVDYTPNQLPRIDCRLAGLAPKLAFSFATKLNAESATQDTFKTISLIHYMKNNVKRLNVNKCYLAVFPSQWSNTTWTLGPDFMIPNYLTFNLKDKSISIEDVNAPILRTEYIIKKYDSYGREIG